MSPTAIDPIPSLQVDAASFAGIAEEYDLFVLDVHGVVLNKPLSGFVVDVGERTGEGGPELLTRWRHELRTPFWEGRLDEREMWSRLAPGTDPSSLRDDLESRFAPGPLFDSVVASDRRMWLLSNHRSDWLLPRLDRFGLSDRFERVLVSDRLGAAKPSPQAFGAIAECSRSTRLCFVDDQARNVDGARALGVLARLLRPDQPTSGAPSPTQCDDEGRPSACT